jgi:hypothetical protein
MKLKVAKSGVKKVGSDETYPVLGEAPLHKVSSDPTYFDVRLHAIVIPSGAA